MILPRLQDTGSIKKSIIYILAKNNWKLKFNFNNICNSFKNHEILRGKFNNMYKTCHTENYKLLLIEIKEYISKWRDIVYSWIKNFSFVKVSVSPNLTIDLLSKSYQSFCC